MTGLYLPGAKWMPISYRAEAGKFTTPPLGYIPHVPVSNGSLFAYFNGLKSPARKFSTAWVAKDGHSEQYQSLDTKPWAQAAGNGQYHAFEVEGYPNEPYTAAQINTLARWHNFLGTPDRLAETPGATGIGTHYMGGKAWGGHSCPDPQAGVGPRSKQRPAIIARAQALRTTAPTGDAPMSAAEKDAILTALANHETNERNRYGSAGDRYADLAGRATTQTAQIAALTAAMAALAAHPDLTAAQITKIISDAITASVKVTGVLTVVPT